MNTSDIGDLVAAEIFKELRARLPLGSTGTYGLELAALQNWGASAISKLDEHPYVYAVFQEAIYRHACGGIFGDVEVAIEHAKELAARDQDDHHEYKVVPFRLDEGRQHEQPEGDWTPFCFFRPPEMEAVYTCKKGHIP